MEHLPSPDNLGNDGYFISNKNGDILQTESKPIVFSTTKQAQAVKGYAKLTLLMEYCNCCKPNNNFVYKLFIRCDGSIDSNLYEVSQMRAMDVYFQNYSDVEKLIKDPNWKCVLNMYFGLDNK